MSRRYFLDQDDDGHWYVVPTDKRVQWEQWFGSDDYDTGLVPEFAIELGHDPSLVSFTDPESPYVKNLGNC